MARNSFGTSTPPLHVNRSEWTTETRRRLVAPSPESDGCVCGSSPEEHWSTSALDLSLARRNLTNTLAMDGMVKGIVTGDGGGDAIMSESHYRVAF